MIAKIKKHLRLLERAEASLKAIRADLENTLASASAIGNAAEATAASKAPRIRTAVVKPVAPKPEAGAKVAKTSKSVKAEKPTKATKLKKRKADKAALSAKAEKASPRLKKKKRAK